MYKYEFYIGNNDKDTKEFDERIQRNAIDFFDVRFPDGYTLTNAVGRYQHNNGDVVKELTSIFTVFTDYELLDIELLQYDLKDLCNQESILITKQETEVLF